MNDDTVKRAEDYEQRLAHAGSTEDLIDGLVQGAKRSKRLMRWLVISLIFDILLSLGLGGVTLATYRNDREVNDLSHVSCSQSVKNSLVINHFLDLLIENTQTSKLLTPKEIVDRVAGYQSLIIKIPRC